MAKGRRDDRGPDSDDDGTARARGLEPGKRTATGAPIRPPPAYPGKRTLTQQLGPKPAGLPVLGDPERALAGKGSGTPIDPQLAARVTAVTGVDVAHARVHHDEVAHEATRAIRARAFALGSDIFLGEGEQASDPALLAHELAHVAQQQGGAPRTQPKVAVGAANDPAEAHADAVAAQVTSGAAPTALLVDRGPVVAGQILKTEFADQLRTQIVAVVEQEVGVLGAAVGCPYIERYFTKYTALPAASAEALLRKWIPAAAGTRDARALLALAITRVRDAVRVWNKTGALPPDLAAADPDVASSVPVAGAGVARRQSVESLSGELGPGSAVDGPVAARMSASLGTDVSHARVHTGPVAQAKAAEQDATAFAVGEHVVMGAGAPQPGSQHGDALLAHELAHVAQQKDAAADPQARRKPIGDEAAAAETNANQQVGRAAGLAKLDEALLRTPLQLQRCSGDTPAVTPPQKVVQTNIPGPQMMKIAGDWFRVTWNDDGFRALSIKYDGPLEPGFGGGHNELRLDYDRTRLLAPRVVAEADDRIVYDLYGDNSERVILTGIVEPEGANERRYTFSASINGAKPPEFGDGAVRVKLPEAGKPPAAGLPSDVAKREAPIAKQVTLGGDTFDLTARKLGTTDKVHFAIGGQRETYQGMAQLESDAVQLAKMPDQLHFDISDKGRDLFIDFDGDKQPDVRISHTMSVQPHYPMDGTVKQTRTHHLRLFDKDGVFFREHLFESYGTPLAIPKGQDEAANVPDLNAAWPSDRPPAQGDVPGQQPQPVDRPGNLTEVRIDGDGDRSKELLLRFKLVQSNKDAPIELEVIRLDGETRDSRSTTFSVNGLNDKIGFGSPFVNVTQVTDGHAPTTMDVSGPVADVTKLVLSPPRMSPAEWIYDLDAGGAKSSFTFPAPKTAVKALVDGKPPDATKAGDLTQYDLTVGEYGDVFRFQLDRNAERATFTIRPMVQGQGVGAVDLPLPTWTTGLKLASGDPRTIAFDLGRGPNDLVIYDRLEAGVDPASSRTHVLTLTGAGVGSERSLRFVALGVLQQDKKESSDAIMSAQADQGDFAGFEKRIDAAVVKARKQALEDGNIGKRLYSSWEKLSLLLIELDGERTTAEKDKTKSIDVALVVRAAGAAREVQDALEDETKGAAKKDHGRDANQFTKRAVWNQTIGSGYELSSFLSQMNFKAAEPAYTALLDGIDSWITHQIKEKPGGDKAAEQHEYLRGVAREMHSIENKQPLRIYATFTPDEDKSSHVPLNLFVFKDGGDWHLKDLTNPKDTFDDTVDATNDAFPPEALFQKLNWKKHFPVGQIVYRLPGGRDGTVECTGKRKWYDWFADVSLALAVIGVTALTAGAGTVAAVALAGAGLAGAVAAGGDLQDSISHNHVDAKTVVLDVAQIAGGLLGGAQVLGGRLIKVAAAADEAVEAGIAGSARVSGAWASLAGLAGRYYVPIAIGSAVSNGATLLVMTADAIDAVQAIVGNSQMSGQAKREALTKVLTQFIIIGGITAMAVHGDIASAMEGRPAIEIVDVGGEPVVVKAGTKLVLKPTIGSPEIIAADGSITKVGKERLGSLEDPLRKRLLTLDQSTMGKMLTLEDEGLAKLAKLDNPTLVKLAALDDASLARVAKLDDAGLHAFLKLDAKAMAELAGLPGLANVMKLKPDQIVKFRDVPGPLRVTLAGASAETIELVLARKPAITGLAAMTPDEAKALLGKIDPAGAKAAALWDLPFATLKRLGTALDGPQLANLATLSEAELGKLANMTSQQVGNLAKLPAADLEVIAKLDHPTIEKASKIPSDALAPMSPLTEAKVKAKVADVDAVDHAIETQLNDRAHHLRDTNFYDRGGLANPGGNIKVKSVSKSGKPVDVPIESPEYVRLEPIPSPPAPPPPTTIVKVEAEGKSRVSGKTVKGEVVKDGATFLAPKPGQTGITTVDVTTSRGTTAYTNVEQPPPGTRIAIKPGDMEKGVAGGHTRASWDTAVATYGDSVKPTSETKIGFQLPGSPNTVEMSAIKYAVESPGKGGAPPTRKPISDPKTIFEKPADLDAFEKHMRPYMSAKVEALKSGTPPADGTIVEFAVPVKTTSGADASLNVGFPWRVDSTGNPKMQTWWVAEGAFTKGSVFNP